MKVKVCKGRRCSEKFSSYIADRCEKDKKFYNVPEDEIEIQQSPCMGKCKKSPCINIDGEIYTHMSPAKVSEIVFKDKK